MVGANDHLKYKYIELIHAEYRLFKRIQAIHKNRNNTNTSKEGKQWIINKCLSIFNKLYLI